MKIKIVDREYLLRFAYSTGAEVHDAMQPLYSRRAQGAVEALLMNTENEVVYYGNAVCSATDKLVWATGRKLAFERAIRTLPREERGKVWAQYFEITKAKIKTAAPVEKIPESRLTKVLGRIESLLNSWSGPKPSRSVDQQVRLEPKVAVPATMTFEAAQPPPPIAGSNIGVTGTSPRGGRR